MSQPKLTHRRKQLVSAVLNPQNKSVAQAAKSIDMHRGDAYVMLSNPIVATELETKRGQQLDKVRGLEAALNRIEHKITAKLESGAIEVQDWVQAVAGLREILGIREKALDIKERTGGDLEQSIPQSAHDQAKAIKHSIWWRAVRYTLKYKSKAESKLGQAYPG